MTTHFIVGFSSALVGSLVAQSSATGCDCSCDTPPVARSVFGTQKRRDTLHQPAATLALGPLPAAKERKVRQGGLEKGATP